jgi:hypothetical protein
MSPKYQVRAQLRQIQRGVVEQIDSAYPSCRRLKKVIGWTYNMVVILECCYTIVAAQMNSLMDSKTRNGLMRMKSRPRSRGKGRLRSSARNVPK